MNISKEAIEAAARELNIYVTPWEDLEEEQRNGWRSQAHAALRAAAPLLIAQAWDEGWNVGYDDRTSSTDDRNHEYAQNPYLAEGTGL